jgi:hypothetical protein
MRKMLRKTPGFPALEKGTSQEKKRNTGRKVGLRENSRS